jgi:hypothetical protein
MAIQPARTSIQSTDSPTTGIYTNTKTRQAAAKHIQRSYRDESPTQTYLMLDRALSEAQSQKELCKNNNNNDQTVNDDSTYISNEEDDDDDEGLDSRCQERSLCGLNECMHELLMDSGKFFYECFAKP